MIGERNLAPGWFPPILVVETPFPPDDSSAGYERGTYVSQAWDEATTYAAIELADKVVDHLDALTKSKTDAPDRNTRLKEFCRRFAERAFRRPLSDDERHLFVDAPFEGNGDGTSAARKAVLLTLKSPRFLYLGLKAGSPDDYTVASRLSFGLWDSLPDRELLEAASRGKLHTHDEAARQAQRMLADPRARSKLRQFFHHWLRVDPTREISKDQETYPGFDEGVVSDLLTSLDLFLEEVLWSEASDFRRLLLDDGVYLNARLRIISVSRFLRKTVSRELPWARPCERAF